MAFGFRLCAPRNLLMLRRILFVILGLILALLVAWWSVAFKPWYNRTLAWRIIAISGDRTVSVVGPAGYNYNPEFTQLLQERFPLGSPAEPAVRELEANGFQCDPRRYKERARIDCMRGFGHILPVPIARIWLVSIHLDDHERIQNVFGSKHWDGP
jgi:hypothetical protein